MSLMGTSKDNEFSVFLYKNQFYQKVGWNDWNSQVPSGSALERSNIKETGSLPSFFWVIRNSPKSFNVMPFLYKFHSCKRSDI